MYSIVRTGKNPDAFRLPRFVIGHAIRTRHDIEASEKALVPGLWKRVTDNQELAQLRGRIGENYYGVINDYESDQNGWYTKIVGVGVNHLIDIPADLVAVSIPHRTRIVYQALSDMPAALSAAWDRVWEEVGPHHRSRRIATDVEIHQPNGDIHVLAVPTDEAK
jgi:Uncharacterized protein conserved in bacteria